MNRKSKSFGRRSSILKLDANWDNDTGILGRNRQSSRRVSFAETYQVKEFPRDSPSAFKHVDHDVEDAPEPADNGGQTKNEGITGLDKLLTGTIQTPYQTNTDYSIPDMASASFNLFDKTILDPVDMETTYAGGEIGSYFPQSQMDFQNEPSVELTFDASSLLQSLKSKTSDSLKTLHIYSPNRERNIQDSDVQSALNDDRLPLNINFSHHDKENIMVPMETFQCVGNKSGPGPKALIERFLSRDSDLLNTQTMNDEMEMTCADGFFAAEKENVMIQMNTTMNMEETVPVGGILNTSSATATNKPYKPGGLKMQSDYSDENEGNDRTRCFNFGEDDYAMEETKCIGGILNGSARSVLRSGEMKTNKEGGDDSVSTLSKSIVADSKQTDQTINFKYSDMDEDIEETEVVGVYNADSVDGDIGMDITLDVSQSVPMEETKALSSNIVTEPQIKIPVGAENNIDGVMDKTIKLSEAMEETKPIGRILKYVTVTDQLNTSTGLPVSVIDTTTKLSEAMEETRPVGGILDTSVSDNKDARRNPVLNKINETINQTMPVEETRPVGGILDISVSGNTDEGRNPVLNKINETINQTMPVEETRPVGGILDTSVSDNKDARRNPVVNKINETITQTMPVEETRPVGGILDIPVSGNTDAGRNPVLNMFNETINQTMPVEETRPVGGILNKTEDKTLYFEDVNTDWTSQDLKNKQLGKASDGTLENKQQLTFAMEETKCITSVIEVELKGKDAPITENYEDILPVTNKTVLDMSDMQITRTGFERRDPDIEQFVQMEDVKVDEEITFKGLKNKRNFDDCRETDDKTKEFTQTTINLTKLREKLILSRRKSMTKTPSKIYPFCPNSLTLSASKGACKVVTARDVTGSPVHKRQKLFSSPDVDQTESTSTFLTTVPDSDVDKSVLQNTQSSHFYGIDDEPMPDTMNVSLSPGSSNNDRNNSHSSHDTTSTTQHEVNASHSSNNDTRSSTSVNMSMMSNKSFAVSSFVIPDGPMTLDTFYKLTFSLLSKVQVSRYSTVFIPKIDLDDLIEVIEAELTIGAKVKAKKKCKEKFVELSSRSQENIEWLEKMLEETQPKIFEDCANASSAELKTIDSELRSLLLACHKQVYTAWKKGTKEMFDEALQDIQENGIKKAGEILDKTRTDNKSVDELLASLDEDLKDLEEKEQTLTELGRKQENLKMEMVKVTDCVESESDVQTQLQSTLCQYAEQDKHMEEKASLSEQILSHLICMEWQLEELDDNKAVFSFLDAKVELCVEFQPGIKEKSIRNISLNTVELTDTSCFEEKVAINFVSRGISMIDLRTKYKTISSLKELLHEVECTMSEIRRFCTELETICVDHVFNYVNDRFLIELSSRETLDFITLELTFDPSHPLTRPVCCVATVQIGKLLCSDIEKQLQTVEPGKDYLGRLLRSVDFKQLHSR